MTGTILRFQDLERFGRIVRSYRAARRIRLEVPDLLGRGSEVERDLLALPGVESAAANPGSGRVLVTYPRSVRVVGRTSRTQKAVRPSSRPAVDGEEGAAGTLKKGEAWHSLPIGEVFERLDAELRGLDCDEADRRLERFGPNALHDTVDRSRLEILVGQLANLPALLLLGSSSLSLLLRDLLDAGAIFGVVGLNTGIGYTVEKKNEDLLASWRRLEAGEAQVIRGGQLRVVAATDLVPGDVLLCRTGDVVPADARVIDAHRLACNEAALTGESESRGKDAAAVRTDTPLAERSSMIYAGTTIVAGRGRAVVIATGAGTEVARVRHLLEAQKAPRTPLEKRLEQLANRVAGLGVASGALSGLIGAVRGRPLGDVIRNAVALGVAAIPEGLPVVSTAALVRTMQRMRERGMVVRRVASAETLGGVTVICADKTGTLTENAMRLDVLEVGGKQVDLGNLRCAASRIFSEPAALALATAVLNSDVDVQQHSDKLEIFGSSTEQALILAAARAGLDRSELRRLFPRRLLKERGGGVHYVVSVHDAPEGGAVAFIKGAPEQVLRLCARDLEGRLSAARRRRILARNDALAGRGLRVLALGWRRLGGRGGGNVEKGYTLIGLVGLGDPLRPGAADAVRAAADAGIRTVLVTGDQRRTAEAIARAVGLTGETLEGARVAELLERGMRDRLRKASVFCRVAPAEKVSIVRALREAGEIVAMAGDGINDAPALKAADIGIAVGARANDLARQAADVVLENDDLRSILSAVSEGRIVQDNLRRAIRYLLATNASETALVLGATLTGARDPLTPLQLLWINLLSDTLPALGLALEPGRSDVLNRDPAPPNAPLVGPKGRRQVARDGILLAALGAGGLAMGGPPAAFSTLTAAQLGYAIACRAPFRPPTGRFASLVGAAIALQAGTLISAPLRKLLGLPSNRHTAEVLGFAAGLFLPWLSVRAGGDAVIVRRGRAAIEPAAAEVREHGKDNARGTDEAGHARRREVRA